MSVTMGVQAHLATVSSFFSSSASAIEEIPGLPVHAFLTF